MYSLLDTMVTKGTDYNDFKKEVNKIAKLTKARTIKWDDVIIYSYQGESNVTNPNEEPRLLFIELNPHNLWNMIPRPVLGKVVGFKKSDMEKKLGKDGLKELVTKTKFLLKIKSNKYKELENWRMISVSDTIYPTLTQRLRIAGQLAVEPSLERDIFFAKGIEEQVGNSFTGIFRKSETTDFEKMFATLSDRYEFETQTILYQIIDMLQGNSLGKVEVIKWSIDHSFTDIYVQFPEKGDQIAKMYNLPDKVIPGLYLSTSDIGSSSIICRGTWNINGATTTINELSFKHIGNLDAKDILSEVAKNIFSEYTQLPTVLCGLLQKNITEPSWDLTTDVGQKTNKDAVKDAFKTAFKDCGIVEAIGKKNEKVLFESVLDEYDYSSHFTAYEIVREMMELPNRVSGLSRNEVHKLAKACSKAPYVNFNKKSKKGTVVLTA